MSALVLTGGHVFDGRRRRTDTAVAVRDGVIVGLGDDDEACRAAGPDAARIDLAGGLVLPGFTDAHMHPLVGGLERLRCELTDLHSVEDYLESIAAHHAAHPDAAWFRGGGWSVDLFGERGPSAALLDRVVPDRPAFVMSSDHHNAWVNSRALALAGITAATPDPPDGWIERDAEGRPTGTLREAAAALVQRLVPRDASENARALREAQDYLHGWGVTGWHDALIGGYAGLDDPTQAYLDLIAAGELTAEVSCSQWWDRHRGPEQVADLLAERARLEAHGLHAPSVKIMVDGVAETFTATVSEPYRGTVHCPCGDAGLSFLPRRELVDAVVALDAARLGVHFHAIGDRAVHDALDAVEAARDAHGPSGVAHQIAHLQLVHPQDRPRFGALGVTANVQGMWITNASAAVAMLLPHLDPERVDWHYPLADIASGQAGLAGGSDWPVNPPEPMQAVHALVNRRGLDDSSPPLVPDQALTLDQALGAYTSGSARVSRLGDVGVVRPGAIADLAVLDRDPYAGPVERIGEAEVVVTIAAGALVHRR